MASALVVVPLAAALLCALPFTSRLARPLCVVAALVVTAIASASFSLSGTAGLRTTWAPALGAGYAVDVDSLSATFLTLVGLVFAIGAAASARVPHRRAYFGLWSLLLALVVGVFVARDLLLFFIFWEAMLVPLAMLLWQWGGTDRRAATDRMLVHTLGGSALLLVGIVSVAVARGTLDIDALAARQVPASAQVLPALFFLAAFAVRLPLFPFHGWLPRAFVAAPIPVGLALAGGVATSAAYAIVRVCLYVFPQGMSTAAPVLVSLAAVGTLYAALVATRQNDLRGLIAFASVSQQNLVALALFAATVTSLRGAVLASVSSGLVIAAALLLAAMLAQRTSSFALSKAGGLAASAPMMASLFALTAFALTAIPGTSGFAGVAVALAGTFERFPAAAAAATLVLIVSAVYGIGAVRRAFHGPPLSSGADLRWREHLLVVPLLALVVALGVAPRILLDRIPDDVLPSMDIGR